MAAIAYALLSQALGKEIYGIFFCHQKAINLSSVDSRSNDFLRWKMQRMFAFVFFCPCPHRIGCRFVVFFYLVCVTLCGIRFMRCTELYHIVHSNNKQTQLMFTIRLMWRKKKIVTSLSVFSFILFISWLTLLLRLWQQIKRIEIKK